MAKKAASKTTASKKKTTTKKASSTKSTAKKSTAKKTTATKKAASKATETKQETKKAPAKPKKGSMEEKLRALYDLQVIDSRIDKIRAMRGELPLEVEDLEKELEGLRGKIENLESELADLDTQINHKNIAIKDAQALIKKYEEQQNNVRNNREFEALSKEVEFQNLEIQLAEKRIGEYKVKIEHKNELLESAKAKLDERTNDLEVKKNDLEDILKETDKEEKFLLKKSDEFAAKIEDKLLNQYRRIRENSANGLAVVTIERGASGGSFFVIPPQRQIDIAQRKKIVFSEHCGRILVDPELAEQEEEKIESMLK